MATQTFHISFPDQWAKEIKREMKKDHFTPTEYFKTLYRNYREEKQVLKDFEESKRDLREGRVIEADSLADLIEKK